MEIKTISIERAKGVLAFNFIGAKRYFHLIPLTPKI